MTQIGYWLSSEEHGPNELVSCARRAEEAGFAYAQISDHYLPWTDRQGNAPFAWTVIGGIAATTTKLGLGTGVTCPLIRYHPAIIAQAVATAATMMPGRFILGIGTGERLNEHILGDHFPEINIRQDMLEEAVDLMRKLWHGDMTSYYGNYYIVENAQVFTLPKQLPPIYMAAGGPESATIAGKIADGLIDTSPDKKLVKTFEQAGGKGKPKYAQLSLCYAPDEKQALKTAFEIWPTAALPGNLGSELSIPKSYEAASKLVTEDMIAKTIIYGPEPTKYLQRIHEYIDAGFDHIALHQIGPDQDRFIDFAKKNILPEFQKS